MDILVALVGGLTACALFAMPFVMGPPLVDAYRELSAELPWPTELALAFWPSPLLGVGVATLVALAFRREDVVHRRLLLAASALAGCVAVGAVWYALHLPLYEIAGAIRAE